MKRFLKWFAIIIISLLLMAQLIPRPEKNTGTVEGPQHINLVATIPDNVNTILQNACYDCHSNHTRYPWYTNIQPLALWMGDHVTEGKSELNFSEFAGYSPRKQQKKWEEIAEEVEKGNMPLESYTYAHQEAKLTDAERQELIRWAKSNISSP